MPTLAAPAGDIFIARSDRPIRLPAMLDARNTDAARPIRITSAQYFDTDGRKLREYVPTAKTIGPMGTYELFIPRSDDSGGSGANFVIEWKADAPVNPPVVEGLHAHLPSGRSIAFITSARPIFAD